MADNLELVPESFAELLRIRRKELGMSQKAAAERIGMSESMLAMVETERRSPNMELILDITASLDLDRAMVVRLAPASMQQRLAEAFRGQPDEDAGPYLPLAERLDLTLVKTDGTLRAAGANRLLYGLESEFPDAYLVDVDPSDPGSPMPGCHRVLIAPRAKVMEGAPVLLLRPRGMGLRRVYWSDEFVIFESQGSREVLQVATLKELVASREAAMLPVAETWSRHIHTGKLF